MRSQTMIPVPAVGPTEAEGERATVQHNHAVSLADRRLVPEVPIGLTNSLSMDGSAPTEEAGGGQPEGVAEAEEHSSASAPCYERSMREAPAATDCAAVLATVEDDSPAAAQPWCIGGSVPGESAPTEIQLALSVSDEDASEEAVALAGEASQLSVEGAASADAHLATTEGLAAGAAYGSQVEVNANGVAESADGGRYTPRLRKACDLCHENRLKCTMLPTGWCEQCTVRGIECKRRMERKRGRPRVTADNIVQLVQRRAAARKQQLPGGASGRVHNAAAREIGAVPQTGVFPSFHDPAIQAAYVAGIQAATQAQQQQAAVMMQYYGPAHPPFHMSPVPQCSHLMAPHGVPPFGAPAHPAHPAFGGSSQPFLANATMAGQYGVGGMGGSAAYQHYAAMYAHFQQQQQQQSPPPGYSGYAQQSAYNPSAVAAAAAAAAAAAHAAAQAPAPGAASLAPDTPSTAGPAGHAHASSHLPQCMPAPAMNASAQPWVSSNVAHPGWK